MMLAYATCLNRENVPWLEPNSQHQFGLSQAGVVFLFSIPKSEHRRPGFVCWCCTNQDKWAAIQSWTFMSLSVCVRQPCEEACDCGTLAFLFPAVVAQFTLALVLNVAHLCETWLTNQSRAFSLVWWVLSWSSWATFWQAAGAAGAGSLFWSTIWVHWTDRCYLIKV